LNLLEQVAESKITLDKIVILSSLAACGPSKIGEFKKKTEDDPSTPVSDYGKSKLEAEIHAKKFMDKLPISIVRTGIVYGPGNYEFINLLKMLSLYFVLYYPGDDFTYSVIHVEDLVNGLLLCAESTKSAGEVFNISSEIPIKWIDLAMAFAKQMGKKPIMIPLPGIILKLAGVLSEIFGNLSGEFPIFNRDKVLEVLAGSWTCDISKAKHVLDYTSGISLDQGAKSFIDWYKSINIKKK
jgi:nucleoside-diphosphate-sugar epimerase